MIPLLASLASIASIALLLPPVPDGDEAPSPQGVIVIFADDLGWADLGCQGAAGFATPHLDRLAREGIRFTDAYVPQPVCTPARAALLTGCHPMRLGLGHRVLFPYSDTGLHPDEETLAESLGSAGYATGCFGKWHLGHHPEFLPTRQGFDVFFGIPFSNDMNRHHYRHNDYHSPPLPLLRGEEMVEEDPDQARFTARFTDEAINFVRGVGDEQRFLVYLAHPMPHRPIHASKEFTGSSELGQYGDVIQEIDHSVGRILTALEELELDRRTLVLFSSDNGPWRRESAGPLRGKKGTAWEGGVRVPLILRWPDAIPAGIVSAEPVSVLDLKPTLDALAGAATSPRGHDGHDLRPLLFQESNAASPHEALLFYRDERLQAVRSGRWKLHLFRPEWEGEAHEPLLFDLVDDPGESRDVAGENSNVVARLEALAEAGRRDLGDAVTGATGEGVRPVGRVTGR